MKTQKAWQHIESIHHPWQGIKGKQYAPRYTRATIASDPFMIKTASFDG